ncbi:MAG: STAS domain-containing protein [Candidatus Brocadiia bacterium]
MIKDIENLDGATLIKLEERLDANSAPEVKSGLHELIQEGNGVLIISLENLDFIDSSGLGVLVGCLRRCAAKGGDLCLVNVPEFARSILELTRLTRVFPIADDLEDALELVKKNTE